MICECAAEEFHIGALAKLEKSFTRRKYLPATLTPDANPVTRSVPRTPFPASVRQMPVKFRRGTEPLTPEQPLDPAPVILDTPKVILFCSSGVI